MTDQKGSVEGKPDNHIHQGALNNGQNPKPSISMPAPLPHGADDLPPDIGGVPVTMFNMPDDEIKAFKRSQLQRMTPEQYKENAEAIALAQTHNLIIDDVTPPEVIAEQEAAAKKTADTWRAAINIRETRKASNAAFKELQSVKFDLEQAKKTDPNSAEAYGLEKKVGELSEAWKAANQAEKDAVTPTTEATE